MNFKDVKGMVEGKNITVGHPFGQYNINNVKVVDNITSYIFTDGTATIKVSSQYGFISADNAITVVDWDRCFLFLITVRS